MKQYYKRVLILNGYARQVLPLAYGFRKNNCHVTILCHSKLDIGYLTRYAHKKILKRCAKDDYNKQNEYITEVIENNNFDLVIPLNDYSALHLSNNKEKFLKYSNIFVEEKSTFNLFIDKYQTMKICMDNNINCPKTYMINSIEEVESKLKYPFVAKPRTSCGSIGFYIIKNKEMLISFFNSGIDLSTYIFQEYVSQEGPQFGAEAFRDKKGEMIFLMSNSKPRFFPVDGGSPTVNVSIKNEEIERLTTEILEKANWHGYANVDLLYDIQSNEYKIIEVNPRPSAATKLNYVVGIDIARIILDYEFNIENQIKYSEYKVGKGISCFMTDILWFLKSKSGFKSKIRWFGRIKYKDVIFSLRDPLPVFGFVLQSIKSYRKEMKKRKRL